MAVFDSIKSSGLSQYNMSARLEDIQLDLNFYCQLLFQQAVI